MTEDQADQIISLLRELKGASQVVWITLLTILAVVALRDYGKGEK